VNNNNEKEQTDKNDDFIYFGIFFTSLSQNIQKCQHKDEYEYEEREEEVLRETKTKKKTTTTSRRRRRRRQRRRKD